MKKEFYFHIPQPCHEDWDKMTPAAKGRFCESCSKQVVDFSLMTDQEVLNYFSRNTGKVCGRFANDQLERPFAEAKQQKKKTWLIAMIMPLLLLVNKVNAQKKTNSAIKDKIAVKPVDINSNPLVLGKVLPKITPVEIVKPETQCTKPIGEIVLIAPQEQKIIKGKIINEKGEPIPFATIHAQETTLFTSADSAGNFELQTKSTIDSIAIEASAVGYESNETKISERENDITITLKQREIYLPNVIVSSESLRGSLGGLVAVCVVKNNYIKDTIQKIFKPQFFKAYPNPVSKESIVHIEIKRAGEYSIQLLDVNSKPILVQDFIAVNKKAVTSINIPASLSSGMYYIRVIDEKTKKQYSDKIIVQ